MEASKKVTTIYANGLITLYTASRSSSDVYILRLNLSIVDPVTRSRDFETENCRKTHIFHSVPEAKQLRLIVPVTERAWYLQEHKITTRGSRYIPYQ